MHESCCIYSCVLHIELIFPPVPSTSAQPVSELSTDALRETSSVVTNLTYRETHCKYNEGDLAVE